MVPLGSHDRTLAAGAMGMSLFFVLSGFLITSTLQSHPDVFAFLVKRLARIVPLAYLYTTIIFTIIVFQPVDALLTDTFLANYIDINAYNWHFWSVCVEMQFYFAVAIAVWLLGRRALWLLWPSCIVVTLLRIQAGSFMDFRTHLRVDEILSGACVAMAFKDTWRGALRFPTPLLLCAVAAWIYTCTPTTGWLQGFRPYTTAAILSILLSYPDIRIARLLSTTPLRYIANISYALYIIHPITYFGWMGTGSFWQRAVKRLVSFTLTFSLAHLSTNWWEKPWRAAAAGLIERRKLLSAADRPPVTATE